MKMAVAMAAVCLSVVGFAGAPDAQAVMRQYELNIPKQSLDSALRELAQQTGLQIARFSDAIDGNAMVGPVEGVKTAEEALKILLAPGGLSYKVVAEGAIAVVQPSATADGAPQEGSSNREGTHQQSLWDRFRLAEVDQGTPANASSVDKDSPMKLDEVVVTAQKREERLVDVPVSIVALSSRELEDRQINTLEDLAAAVPDLSYSKQGNIYSYEIRGVSNASGGYASLVGLYVDEMSVTLGGTAGAQINPVAYDLERVEVLRGPQGTLYGEGAAGGAIRFITRAPQLDHFAFGSDVAVLFTEYGSPSQRVNAMVNAPLVENQLGLRIAGTFTRDGGWLDQPAASMQNINGRDLTNARAKLLWQPISGLNVTAMVTINRDDRGSDFSDVSNSQTFTQLYSLTTVPRLKNNFEVYNLTATYDFSRARLLETVGYLDSSMQMKSQGFTTQILPPAVLPPFAIYSPLTTTKDKLWTDELRLSSLGSTSWNWTAGAFFKHWKDSTENPASYFGLVGTPLAATGSFSASQTLTKSWSAFADTSYQWWDRITLGAGVRYFREQQEFQNKNAPPVVTQQHSATFRATDPRFYVQIRLTNDANIYTSAAKGFRSGGFNTYPPGAPNFDPESVWTYELGTKLRSEREAVSADIAVFLSDYSQFQTSGVAPNGNSTFGLNSFVSNVGTARIKGVEADLMWEPIAKWRLEARGDYVNAKFTEINATKTAYQVGDPLDFVPRYQFTLSAQREFAWLSKKGVARIDYTQQASMSLRNRSIGPWFYGESDVIHTLNFKTDLFWSENLRLGMFAQNLLNDQGFVNPFYISSEGVRSRPRTYGIELGVTLN